METQKKGAGMIRTDELPAAVCSTFYDGGVRFRYDGRHVDLKALANRDGTGWNYETRCAPLTPVKVQQAYSALNQGLCFIECNAESSFSLFPRLGGGWLVRVSEGADRAVACIVEADVLRGFFEEVGERWQIPLQRVLFYYE